MPAQTQPTHSHSKRTAMLAPLNIEVPALDAQHKEALWPLEELKQEQEQ